MNVYIKYKFIFVQINIIKREIKNILLRIVCLKKIIPLNYSSKICVKKKHFHWLVCCIVTSFILW